MHFSKFQIGLLFLLAVGEVAVASAPLYPRDQRVIEISEILRSPELHRKLSPGFQVSQIFRISDTSLLLGDGSQWYEVRYTADYAPHPTEPELNVYRVAVSSVTEAGCGTGLSAGGSSGCSCR